MNPLEKDTIHKAVREQYAKVASPNTSGCCGTTSSCCEEVDTEAKATSLKLGYSNSDINEAPDGANMGLGCGNPKTIASLKTGEVVVDLGSGGGFDCFLALKEVGESGLVIGVDMTPEMISKARRNVEQAGYGNVEFRLGEIENLPIADEVADVVISNCVINLSPDKARVYQESFRVLKTGGRVAISDVVATADLPDELLEDVAMFTGCMSGASTLADTERMLKNAGFVNIVIKPKDESREFIRNWAPGSRIEQYVVSATIEAIKPVSKRTVDLVP